MVQTTRLSLPLLVLFLWLTSLTVNSQKKDCDAKDLKDLQDIANDILKRLNDLIKARTDADGKYKETTLTTEEKKSIAEIQIGWGLFKQLYGKCDEGTCNKVIETLVDILFKVEILEDIIWASLTWYEKLWSHIKSFYGFLKKIREEIEDWLGPIKKAKHLTSFADILYICQEEKNCSKEIGDPHFLVKPDGSDVPVCFDVNAAQGQSFKLFEDTLNGVVINGELTSHSGQPSHLQFFNKMAVIQGAHSLYMDSEVIQLDEDTPTPWQDDIPLKPMEILTSQRRIVIRGFGLDVSARVEVNVFGGLNLYVYVDEGADRDRFGGLIGEAIKCIGSVDEVGANKASIATCGGRQVDASLALRDQRRTECWLTDADDLFDGKSFAASCLRCA